MIMGAQGSNAGHESMNETGRLSEMLRRYLAEPTCGWSIGTYGAIAEFQWDADEEPLVRADDGLSLASGRGAIRIDLAEEARQIAFERVSASPERWVQGASICMPVTAAAMNRRQVLTEIGPDEDAFRDEDRSAALFDLGLDIPHVDACVRTADDNLGAILRDGAGRSILEPHSPAMAAVQEHSPQRVFLSRLGRVEVYGRIPPPDGLSEAGPHTHLLPDLLASGRSHPAGTPIPIGYVPCLDLYPANPLMDNLGRPHPFDATQFAAFEALLAVWGDPDYLTEKARARAAVREGLMPDEYERPTSRLGRAALRIALRQLAQTEEETPALPAWRAAFDASGARAA
jgi:hypothetical protein